VAQDNNDNEINMLSGFDSLITSLHKQIEQYENTIADKVETIKRLIKLEKERALKDSTKSETGDPQLNRLNICSWKLRVLQNLQWMSEEQALKSITSFKTSMLENLDVEPTAVQDKHFSTIQPTIRRFLEKLCGTLESCNDAMADYLMETKRTQPLSLRIYDDAVAISIQLLQRLHDGITVKEFDRLMGQLISLAKRIEAKMIEKRNYMTDRLAWRGIGVKSFNL